MCATSPFIWKMHVCRCRWNFSLLDCTPPSHTHTETVHMCTVRQCVINVSYDKSIIGSPWCWLLQSQARHWCGLHSRSPWRWSFPRCWWCPQSELLSPYSSAGPWGCQQSPLEEKHHSLCNVTVLTIKWCWFISLLGNSFCTIQDSDISVKLFQITHKNPHILQK